MAKKKVVEEVMDDIELLAELNVQFDASYAEQEKWRLDPFFSLEDKEKMLLGRPSDYLTKTTKSQVYDPRMSTLAIEGANRVMANLPTGEVLALNDRDDEGKNLLMNLIIEKYIVPNANFGHKWKTKLRMVDLGSRVMGAYYVLVDYITEDDYIGPDFMIIPRRCYYPQAGRTSKNRMDYEFVETFKTVEWLEKRKDMQGWKNIGKLLEKIKAGKSKSASTSKENKSFNERMYQEAENTERGKYAQIRLVTRYERKKWVMWAPDYKVVVQDIPNPHKNNSSPIIQKKFIPLDDRLDGLGMFERGKSLQYAHNSLINLYLDGRKKKLFPATIVNPNGVMVNTLENMYKPGGFVYETITGSIREQPLGSQDDNTFFSTSQFLISSMTNQAGTPGDTSTSKSTDPTMGKTPEALKILSSRQDFWDALDQEQMELFIDELYNKIIDILTVNQSKPIKLELFKDDIEKIAETSPDILDVNITGENVPSDMADMDEKPNKKLIRVNKSGSYGTATITKDMIGNSQYRYIVNPGSTIKHDQELEVNNLLGFMKMYIENKQIIDPEMAMNNKKISLDELMTRIVNKSVKDPQKVIIDVPEQPEMGQMPQMQPQMPTVGPEAMQPPMQPQMASQGQPQGMQQMQSQMPQGMPQGGDPDIEQLRQMILGG